VGIPRQSTSEQLIEACPSLQTRCCYACLAPFRRSYCCSKRTLTTTFHAFTCNLRSLALSFPFPHPYLSIHPTLVCTSRSSLSLPQVRSLSCSSIVSRISFFLLGLEHFPGVPTLLFFLEFAIFKGRFVLLSFLRTIQQYLK
jgi:hypothetical protein